MIDYGALSDDHFVNMYLNTEMPLSTQRETVLDYFGRVQKTYPSMRNFYCRDVNDFVLEEEKDQPSYRWMNLEPKRLGSGVVNPVSLDDAIEQHQLCLELAPFMLSVSPLDCEALDLMFAFEFAYKGNQDEIVAEALGIGPAFDSLLSMPGARPLKFEPSLTMLLGSDCRRQCRLQIETRTNAYQVRRNEYPEDLISVYFSLRQYRSLPHSGSFQATLHELRADAERLLQAHVIDQVLRPLAQAIASR
ncbi:hypothetical protein [Planctomicrobium piriforme]|uniref:TIGR04255 family protein n=1 Tax=Planctomicrobium piriforme TaxID=1576369 RepID=A0A1I3JUW5_9PLAN|nr:hypothetical protein [Planctomicrobium piriforme]SFI64042.1 hypothetical protein SAMN05421753_11121 [Planctomicrobium piriforme]